MTPTAVATALKRLPLFEAVSLRLLQDLVEYASLETWWKDPALPAARDDPGASLLHRVGVLETRMPGGPRMERRFNGRWLAEALAASFSLARAFGGRRDELFALLVGADAPAEAPALLSSHWLFVTKSSLFVRRGEVDAIGLVDTAALLARALERTSANAREHALVAVLDATGLSFRRAHVRKGGRESEPVLVLSATQLGEPTWRDGIPAFPHERCHTEICSAMGVPATTAWHVVCVHPGDPGALPRWWLDRFSPQGFHRLVYLTRLGADLRPPPALLALLLRGVWDADTGEGPYFSSVVSTVVLTPTLARRHWCGVEPPWRELPTLEVAPWDAPGDTSARTEPRPFDVRLRRDLCRIRLDPARLAHCDDDPGIARSLDRWARAVTNRQVGLALSGGGATSAALVPFVEALGDHGLPIDVVAGLSGGAILGLYVATDRIPAYSDLLHRVVFQGMLVASTIHSHAIEAALNFEYGGARLEDLDVRFVPVTVEMRTDGAPRPCAVIGGSIGEAVRVSGIGLGLIAPAERRGTRYVDGGIATGLPAALLPDFGADLVIACNSIVPPEGRAPSAYLPAALAGLLRWHSLLDYWANRWGDVWVGFLAMLRQAARDAAADADVYYEVSARETPFLDSFCWLRLDRIRRIAAEGRTWEDELQRALECWRRLRDTGGQ